MDLRYDFDIQWIFPRQLFDDPKTGAFLNNIGFQRQMRGNYVALFRDPRVGEMLQGASDRVQAFFKASGFGLDSYDSGAPDGHFPKEDEVAWEDVVARLNENFEKHPFTKEELNGFDIGAFLSHLSRAEPLEIPGKEPEEPVVTLSARDGASPSSRTDMLPQLAQPGEDGQNDAPWGPFLIKLAMTATAAFFLAQQI